MIVWINNPFDNLPLEGYRPQRYWLLAQAFARAGHTVVLWTSDFSHALLRKRFFTRATLTAAGAQIGPDARLLLIPTRPYGTHVSFARLRSHRAYARAWFHLGSKLVARGHLPKPDLIVTSVPPLSVGLTAQAFRRRWNCKVVVDIQDAWPETFYRLLPFPRGLRARVAPWIFAPIRRWARTVYTGADAIVGVARRYLDLAAASGAKAPAYLCHLGIELPGSFAAPPTAIKQQFLEPASRRRSYRLVYIGNMGRSYDLDTVLRGVRETPGVELHLAGSGPEEWRLRLQAQGSPRILFHGYLRAPDVRALLASSDVGLVPMFDSSCVGVPGKLADYAAAMLPVLNSLTGETAELLARYDAGFTYTAGSLASLKEALRRLVERGEFIPMMRKHMMEMARNEFDAVRLYDGYVAFVMKLFPSTPVGPEPEPV